jgi:hypothetical protein
MCALPYFLVLSSFFLRGPVYLATIARFNSFRVPRAPVWRPRFIPPPSRHRRRRPHLTSFLPPLDVFLPPDKTPDPAASLSM